MERELDLSGVALSASASSGGEVLSASSNADSSSEMEVSSLEVAEIPAASDEANLLVLPTSMMARNVVDVAHNSSVTSFPTNPTVSESETSITSSLASPPKLVEIRRHPTQSHRRFASFSGVTNSDSHSSSSPYAQLCWDPNKKGLVTMLEIDTMNGKRKSRSRLPLDAPSLEDYFPWLHQRNGGVADLSSSSWSWESGHSKSSFSTLTVPEHQGDLTVVEDTSNDNDYCEPIILCGWMIDHIAMTDQEADIYWLLNDGKDVWVEIDDGCAKALRKLWKKSYGQRKMNRNAFQRPGSTDAQEEKRQRYSVLS
jgi:hypothetical protein